VPVLVVWTLAVHIHRRGFEGVLSPIKRSRFQRGVEFVLGCIEFLWTVNLEHLFVLILLSDSHVGCAGFAWSQGDR
jgi:hypothetical protein